MTSASCNVGRGKNGSGDVIGSPGQRHCPGPAWYGHWLTFFPFSGKKNDKWPRLFNLYQMAKLNQERLCQCHEISQFQLLETMSAVFTSSRDVSIVSEGLGLS